MIKAEIRILGFDDGPFERSDKNVPVIGVIYRGGKFLDGILRTDVEVDGMDATKKIVKSINSTRHKSQLKVIMFDGITMGGFNVIDIQEIYEKTKLPVIVINRKCPNLENVKKALKNLKNFKKRWQMVLNAGKIKEMKIADRKIYYQNVGIDDEEVEEIIKLSTTHGYIPEPLRVAHLIATGIVKGESSGRA